MNAEELKRAADLLVKNPAFKAVMKTLDDSAVEEWRSSGAHDVATRERCFSKQNALYELDAALANMARD